MNYHQLTLAHCVTAVLLLAVGVGLTLIAQRRNWRPTLALAIFTALVFRLAILALAYRVTPYDLAHDFQAVGSVTLTHHDPIVAMKVVRWSYLPVYDYPLAAAYWAHIHLHISWLITARAPSILSDLGVVALVGTVTAAAGGRAELRRFQYACNPLPILVSAVHGQVEPACLLFSLAAFAVVLRRGPQISGRATAAAGLLLGLGIGTKTWPVLFGPALLLALPSVRRRWQFAAWTGGTVALLFVSMPLTVGTPINKLVHLAKVMTYYHPPIGTFGWTGMWVAVHPTRLPTTADPLWVNVGSWGTKFALLVVLLAVWWWRRAHPLDIATATTSTMLALTPAFGIQYLLWQTPTRTAYPNRLTTPLNIVIGAYATMFYLVMSMMGWHTWQFTQKIMMIVSLGVVALMIVAMPWDRRVWHRPEKGLPVAERTPDPAKA